MWMTGVARHSQQLRILAYTSRTASSWCLLDLPDAESRRRSRMVAGLEKITSETISIGDRVVNELGPKDRGIAMVFQNYALYPHTVSYTHLTLPTILLV